MPAQPPRPGERPRPGEPEVHQITNAARPHSDDLDARIRRYLISMAVRTLCFVLVLVVHGWARWVFAAGAVALPYVAVIIANNSSRGRGRVALGTPETVRAGLPSSAPPALLTGVVHPREERAAEHGRDQGDGRGDEGPDPLRQSA